MLKEDGGDWVFDVILSRAGFLKLRRWYSSETRATRSSTLNTTPNTTWSQDAVGPLAGEQGTKSCYFVDERKHQSSQEQYMGYSEPQSRSHLCLAQDQRLSEETFIKQGLS